MNLIVVSKDQNMVHDSVGVGRSLLRVNATKLGLPTRQRPDPRSMVHVSEVTIRELEDIASTETPRQGPDETLVLRYLAHVHRCLHSQFFLLRKQRQPRRPMTGTSLWLCWLMPPEECQPPHLGHAATGTLSRDPATARSVVFVVFSIV